MHKKIRALKRNLNNIMQRSYRSILGTDYERPLNSHVVSMHLDISKDEASKILCLWTKKGYVKRIARGVYIMNINPAYEALKKTKCAYCRRILPNC